MAEEYGDLNGWNGSVGRIKMAKTQTEINNETTLTVESPLSPEKKLIFNDKSYKMNRTLYRNIKVVSL